jgi:hypothetical protein
MPRSRDPLVLCLLGLLAANALGFAVAVATGIVDVGAGLAQGSKTNAPPVIWGAQTIGVALLVTRAGASRIAGGALALAASTLSLVAVAADGDLFAAGLGAGHVAIQLTIGAFTLGLWTLLAARLAARPRQVAVA